MNEILHAMKSASSKFITEVCSINYKKTIDPCYFNPENAKSTSSIRNFDTLTTYQIRQKVMYLSPLELRRLRSYELANQRRRLILMIITNELTKKVFEGL